MRYQVNITEETLKQVIIEAAHVEEAKVVGLIAAQKCLPSGYGTTVVSAFRLADKEGNGDK